jgi:phosphoenolpyruvate carboxylase
VLVDNRELLDPLELCFHSLHECGMGVIADGPLLDCLRRAVTFGLFLVRLDVRQDSARHRGHDRNHRLPGPRALRRLGRRTAHQLPQAELKNAARCCRRISNPGRHRRSAGHLPRNRRRAGASLGSYVISMAGAASDVLAVQLLLKEPADPADARGAAVRNPRRPGQRRAGDGACCCCRATAPGCKGRRK